MTITTTRLRELKARASIRSGGVPTDEAREAEEAMAREVLGALPEVGETVTLDLEPTAAQLALDGDARARRVLIEVLAIERHVPSRVRVSLPDGDPA